MARTLAVMTSGGDSPGMNTALRALVRVAAVRGVRVLGVEFGYEGLMEGRFRELTRPDGEGGPLVPEPELDASGQLGGTILGSARSQRFMTPEGRADAARRLEDLSGLVVIGGNGSLTGAHLLARECKTPIVGIPASIDNDIGCSASAIGVDTALNTIVEACDRISDTARAHRRAFIVEVMGRHCGYLAMAAAVSAGADAVLFREQGRGEADILQALEDLVRRNLAEGRTTRRVLVLKAEGVELPTPLLVSRLQERLKDLKGVEARGMVLGHLVRGGSPSHHDRMIAGRLAFAAVEAALEGATDLMVGWQSTVPGGQTTPDPYVKRYPLEQVLAETAALLDGSSPVTQRRVRMMESVQGVLAL